MKRSLTDSAKVDCCCCCCSVPDEIWGQILAYAHYFPPVDGTVLWSVVVQLRPLLTSSLVCHQFHRVALRLLHAVTICDRRTLHCQRADRLPSLNHLIIDSLACSRKCIAQQLSDLPRWSRLTAITLIGCSSDKMPSPVLSAATSLTRLVLNPVPTAKAVDLRCATRLETLLLSAAYIDNAAKFVMRLPNSLTTLRVDAGVYCTGAIELLDPGALQRLTSLTALDLYEVRPNMVHALPHLTRLQRLRLSAPGLLDVTLLRNLTGLRRLNLEHGYAYHDTAQQQVIESATLQQLCGLERLDLKSPVSDATLRALPCLAATLVRLHLTFRYEQTLFLVQLYNLQHLVLDYDFWGPDEYLRNDIVVPRSLRVLVVSLVRGTHTECTVRASVDGASAEEHTVLHFYSSQWCHKVRFSGDDHSQ